MVQRKSSEKLLLVIPVSHACMTAGEILVSVAKGGWEEGVRATQRVSSSFFHHSRCWDTKGGMIGFGRAEKREMTVACVTALNEMIDAGHWRKGTSGSVCSHLTELDEER